MSVFFKAIAEIAIVLLVVGLLYSVTSGFSDFKLANLAENASTFFDKFRG